MHPLISVIVPVYKVEDCIARCLDSLCKQSLSDIEILLIDDASPDNCGKICEEYAARDTRFKVFHNKKNLGLSVARNIGIANAHCDYLMFVDSDDWVHEDFCKKSYECAFNYQADLVLFGSVFVNKPKEEGIILGKKSFRKSGYITQLEALDLLQQKGIGPAAWNKLYRKELFHGILYPPGYLYEDMGTTHKTILKASRIFFLDKVLYYQCYRAGSITTLKTKKIMHDWIVMYLQQYGDLLEWGYPSDKADVLLKNIALTYCITKKPDVSDDYYVFCTKVLLDSKIFPVNYTWKRVILFILFKKCRYLFELLCFLFNKKVC